MCANNRAYRINNNLPKHLASLVQVFHTNVEGHQPCTCANHIEESIGHLYCINKDHHIYRGVFYRHQPIMLFSAHYAMLHCSWISPKMLKIMLTIHVNSGQ